MRIIIIFLEEALQLMVVCLLLFFQVWLNDLERNYMIVKTPVTHCQVWEKCYRIGW